MRFPLEVPRTLKKHMSGIFILELSQTDRITSALHELARCLFKAFTGYSGVQLSSSAISQINLSRYDIPSVNKILLPGVHLC